MKNSAHISWATADDWAAHQSTITRLYIDEDKTLRETIEIMKHDYSFHATPRMYKSRMMLWGLTKHLTAKDVSKVLQDYGSQNSATDAPDKVIVRGRPFDAKKVENYLRRTTTDKFTGLNVPWGSDGGLRNKPAAESSQDSIRQATMPRRLKSPDTFNFSEELMHLTSQLVAGSHDGGIWTMDTNNNLIFSTDALVQWEDQLTAGRYLIDAKKYKHAFKTLDGAFAMMGKLLTNYEPSLLIYLLINAMHYHPDIGQRLLSFAAEMSEAKLSAHHPLTRIWDRLRRAGVEQVRNSAWTILISYVESLEQFYGESRQNLLFVLYWLLNDAFAVGLVGEDECCARLSAIIQQCESTGERTHALQAKVILGNVYMWAKKYPVTKALLKDVMGDNHMDGSIYNKEIEKQSLRQRFHVFKLSGTVEETIQAGRDLIQFLVEYCGSGHLDTVLAASRLRIYLDEHGLPSTGLKLEEYSDPDWDMFCQNLFSS